MRRAPIASQQQVRALREARAYLELSERSWKDRGDVLEQANLILRENVRELREALRRVGQDYAVLVPCGTCAACRLDTALRIAVLLTTPTSEAAGEPAVDGTGTADDQIWSGMNTNELRAEVEKQLNAKEPWTPENFIAKMLAMPLGERLAFVDNFNSPVNLCGCRQAVVQDAGDLCRDCRNAEAFDSLPAAPSVTTEGGKSELSMEDDGMYSVGGLIADIEALEASRAERYAVFGPGMSGRTNDLVEAETWLCNNPAARLYELTQTKEPKL